MLNTVWAVIRDGKIELLEDVVLPEGAKVLVTLVSEEGDATFWQDASQKSLDEVWNNSEDDVYAHLLEK
jgi:predicted DNA-binding antitoxin AbrB/MazE fold protein